MKTECKVSVVLALYNGSEYIIEQLASLKNQKRLADEVLILDDCSTDNSVEICNSYIKANNLNNWKVIRNDQNIGWKRNFLKGFNIACGQYVFCCDQDDIWHDKKIEIMTKIMNEHDNIEILACNLVPKYECAGAKKLEKYNTDDYGESYISEVKMDKLWMEPRRQGCTMCFRKSILPTISEIWFEDCAHDLLLWAYGMTKGSLYIVNEPLITFRRHDNNNTPSNKKTNEVRTKLLNLYITLGERLKNVSEKEDDRQFIDEMIRFYEDRKMAIKDRSLISLLKMLNRINYYPKKASFLGDILALL